MVWQALSGSDMDIPMQQVKADPDAPGGSRGSSRQPTPQPMKGSSKAANKRKASTTPSASIVKKVTAF